MTENSGYDSKLCANPNHSTTNPPTPELEKYVTNLIRHADIMPLAVAKGADQAEIKSGSVASDNTFPMKKNLGYNCSLDHSASAIATTNGGPTQESEKYITTVTNQIRHVHRTLERERDVATSEINKSGSAASDYIIPTKKNLGYNCSLDHSASAIATTNGGPTPECEKFATTVPNLIQTERMFDSEEYSTSDSIPTKANSGYNCSLDHSASAIATTNGGPTQECERYITTVPNQIRNSTLEMDNRPLAVKRNVATTEEYATSDAILTKKNLGYNCSLDHSASAITTTSAGPTQECEQFMTTVPNLIHPSSCSDTASEPMEPPHAYSCSQATLSTNTTTSGPAQEHEEHSTSNAIL